MDAGRNWLVTGATGAVGRCVLARLARGGEPVWALSRAAMPESKPVRWLQVDLYAAQPEAPPAAITHLLSAGPLDGLAAWCRRRPPSPGCRIVALSSTSATVKHASANRSERALAQCLRDSEQALRELAGEHGWNLTLLRPTLIYGNGAGGALGRAVHWAQRLRGLPLPGAASGLRQPVHADDLAQAMLHCAGRDDLGARTLVLPGGETLSYRRMLQRQLDAAAPGLRVRSLPRWLWRPLYALLRRGPAGASGLAAQWLRSGEDLVFDRGDWQVLGLTPRPFRPE